MKNKERGKEKYGIFFWGGGVVHSKHWLHSRLSLFFFFVLPPDWLDPRAAFSLPDPNFPHFSHQGIYQCFQVAEKRKKSITRVISAFLFPSPVRQKVSLYIAWNLERHTQMLTFSLACHLHESQQPGFFLSTAPELLWKFLSGNSVPVEVERLEKFLVGQ